MRNPRHLLLVLGLAALVAWAPLPFGSIQPGARMALQAGAAVALGLALLCSRRDGTFRPAVLPVAALLGLAAWGLVQSLPLPAAAVRLASPESAALQEQARALLDQPAAGTLRLSLAPDLSRGVALWWSALAALVAAASFAGRTRVARRWLLLTLLGAALFQVFLGVRGLSLGGSTIWGVVVPGGGQRLRGTFVNPNHLALYLLIALTATFAWLWWALRRARGPASPERRLLLVAPPLLVWLTLFIAVAFTGSRAGLAAALAATAFQGLVVAAERRRWAVAPLGLGLGALGLGVVADVGLQQGLGRWLATSPYELAWNVRVVAYQASFELWQRFPLTGTGMASFRDAFRLVQPTTAPGAWWHAHSDWLELLVTTGLVGVALLLAGLATLVLRLLAVLWGKNRSEERAAAVAALGALGAVAVASAFDFGLAMPANALTLAVVCGAAAGAPVSLTSSRPQQPRQGETPDDPLLHPRSPSPSVAGEAAPPAP